MPAQGIIFTIAPIPLLVRIALVRRNVHNRTHAVTLPNRLEHMHRSQYIGPIGLDRIAIGQPDQRLRRQVEHDGEQLDSERA